MACILYPIGYEGSKVTNPFSYYNEDTRSFFFVGRAEYHAAYYYTLSGRSTNQRSSMGSHSHSQNSIDDCMRILCRGYCSVR